MQDRSLRSVDFKELGYFVRHVTFFFVQGHDVVLVREDKREFVLLVFDLPEFAGLFFQVFERVCLRYLEDLLEVLFASHLRLIVFLWFDRIYRQHLYRDFVDVGSDLRAVALVLAASTLSSVVGLPNIRLVLALDGADVVDLTFLIVLPEYHDLLINERLHFVGDLFVPLLVF